MAGELSFFMGDLYPNLGRMETGDLSIPEPGDQKAFVDDEAGTAAKRPNNVAQSSHQSIWGSVLIFAGVIVALMVFTN